MSKAQFIESTSSDPAERAIARKVTGILNDTRLDREQRQALVKRAQRELTEYRLRKASQAQLVSQASSAKLPVGYQARGARVANGRVEVAAFKRNGGFVWLDAGEAPQGAARHQILTLPGKAASGKQMPIK
ncbi:hypothetical protein [Comamonas sp. NLF-1-9]|uniref:hypothetical protein n=1 Tax=Comamonas sp. NLF-1-9 TaxID=2853163 RepID=UPI001C437920|nr:hypothetical protein [Comamonas sp. NLF-1-9]QXL84402.1 hypothetical protein KUD94_14515 [Comamonas sp. NLF-1-9]